MRRFIQSSFVLLAILSPAVSDAAESAQSAMLILNQLGSSSPWNCAAMSAMISENKGELCRYGFDLLRIPCVQLYRRRTHARCLRRLSPFGGIAPPHSKYFRDFEYPHDSSRNENARLVPMIALRTN